MSDTEFGFIQLITKHSVFRITARKICYFESQKAAREATLSWAKAKQCYWEKGWGWNMRRGWGVGVRMKAEWEIECRNSESWSMQRQLYQLQLGWRRVLLGRREHDVTGVGCCYVKPTWEESFWSCCSWLSYPGQGIWTAEECLAQLNVTEMTLPSRHKLF